MRRIVLAAAVALLGASALSNLSETSPLQMVQPNQLSTPEGFGLAVVALLFPFALVGLLLSSPHKGRLLIFLLAMGAVAILVLVNVPLYNLVDSTYSR